MRRNKCKDRPSVTISGINTAKHLQNTSASARLRLICCFFLRSSRRPCTSSMLISSVSVDSLLSAQLFHSSTRGCNELMNPNAKHRERKIRRERTNFVRINQSNFLLAVVSSRETCQSDFFNTLQSSGIFPFSNVKLNVVIATRCLSDPPLHKEFPMRNLLDLPCSIVSEDARVHHSISMSHTTGNGYMDVLMR